MNGKVALHKKKHVNKKSLGSYILYGFSFAFHVSNSMLIMFFNSLYVCINDIIAFVGLNLQDSVIH